MGLKGFTARQLVQLFDGMYPIVAPSCPYSSPEILLLLLVMTASTKETIWVHNYNPFGVGFVNG